MIYRVKGSIRFDSKSMIKVDCSGKTISVIMNAPVFSSIVSAELARVLANLRV